MINIQNNILKSTALQEDIGKKPHMQFNKEATIERESREMT
jgi:hypothetical protein